MGKVKTGDPDSGKAQVIENVTLKYLVFLCSYWNIHIHNYKHTLGKHLVW